MLADLLADLSQKVDGQIEFEICPVEEIRQETPGKFKFVVSRLVENKSMSDARTVA